MLRRCKNFSKPFKVAVCRYHSLFDLRGESITSEGIHQSYLAEGHLTNPMETHFFKAGRQCSAIRWKLSLHCLGRYVQKVALLVFVVLEITLLFVPLMLLAATWSKTTETLMTCDAYRNSCQQLFCCRTRFSVGGTITVLQKRKETFSIQ